MQRDINKDAQRYAILQKADETLVSELKATLTEEQLLRLEVYIPAYAHLEGCAEGCTGCECACHTSLRAIIQLQAMQYMEEALLWDETTLSGTMFIMYNNFGKLYDMAREALANGEITQEEYDLINEDMNSYYTKLFMIFYKFGFDPYMTSPVYDFNVISGGKIINAANGYSADGDGYVTFELTQKEVQLNGTIVIPYGVKVKIRINDNFASSLPNESHVTIKRSSENALLMFRILGELKVEGTQIGDHRIIFDGNNMMGCGFLLDYQDLWTENDGSNARPRLEMDWAWIQHMNNDGVNHFEDVFKGVYNAATIPSWDCSSAIMIRHGDIDLWEVHISDNRNTNDNGIIRAYARKWDYAPGDYYATMKLNSCHIYNNYSGDVYGGIVKAGGPEVACIMEVTGGQAFGNTSTGWGGVFLWAANTNLPDERQSKATINNFLAYNNKAELGGVISCESVMEVTGCKLYNNKAKAGGAIAAFPFTRDQVSDTGANACGLTLGSGNHIYENEAKGGTADQFIFPPNGAESKTYPIGGGGIWLYMNVPGWDCSLDIGTGNEIRNNTARNGGGVMVTHVNGNVTNLNITGANIHDNSADLNGGGLALINAELTASSGDISNNTASGNGGGVYSVLSDTLINNPETPYQSDVTINANMNIKNNTAKNGGGIYLDGGGTLTVNGGYITGNKANGLPANVTGDGAEPPHYTGGVTAYNADGNYNAGVGGGVYVNNGTMTITGTTIGLYDNTADFAADDIYMKQAVGTSIKFPLVYEMSGVASGIQGWFEDYAIGDNRYSDGTRWKRDGQPIKRYRHAEQENKDADKILYRGTGEESNKYVCLTLGEAVGDMKVTKQVEGTTDTTTEFGFTVTVSDGTIENVVIDNIPTSVNSKSATFKLRHNQTATLTGLTYYTHVTVTETPVNGYNTQVKVGETVLDAAGVEFAFQDYDVVVTNTFAGIPVHVTKVGDALDENKTFTFQPIVNGTPGTAQTIKKGETFTFYVDKRALVEVKELGAANYRTSLHVDTKMEAEDGEVSVSTLQFAEDAYASGGQYVCHFDGVNSLTLPIQAPASEARVSIRYADAQENGRTFQFLFGNERSTDWRTEKTGNWDGDGHWWNATHSQVFTLISGKTNITFDSYNGMSPPNLDFVTVHFDIDSLTLDNDSSRASGEFGVMGETTFTFTNTPVTHVTVSTAYAASADISTFK